ncbi:serine/threonine protein kinase [Candidatus Uabimicrobium sp. HlEnr_7]|uniref:serine/threonine protein kinase n=1 Tax=Candidatus Uabimicrobium helgolandensis TaxID=3095367 RepID=UPI0035579B73
MVDYKQILKTAIEAQYLSPQQANEIFATVQKLQQQNLEVPFEEMLSKYMMTEQWMDLKKRINSSVQKTQHHAHDQPPKKQMAKSAFELEELKISQDQVDRYKIIKTLGQGAMGSVYLANDTKHDRQVALKTMLPNLANNEIAVKRFFQEAQAMQLLHNPNIIKIYEFGQSGENLYLSMQYVEGAPLSDLIPQKMSMLKIAEIVAKTARALDYAHSKKIIHRDIKPSNIMMEKDNPILMDFGLAKEVQGNAKLTKTGAMLGTPSYMAPEQVKAQRKEIDNQTDIWALGVTMYEMLTTRLPFPGNQHFAVMRKIVNEEPTPPTALNPLVSKDLEKICSKAMAKNKSHRYTSAMDMAEDLECFLSGQEIPIRKRTVRSKKSFFNHFYLAAAVIVLLGIFSIQNIQKIKAKEKKIKVKEEKIKTLENSLYSYQNEFKEVIAEINSAKKISSGEMVKKILLLQNKNSGWYKRDNFVEVYGVMLKMLNVTLKSPFSDSENKYLHHHGFLINKTIELLQKIFDSRGEFNSEQLRDFYFLYKKIGIEHSLHPFCEKAFLAKACSLKIDNDEVKKDQYIIQLYIDNQKRRELVQIKNQNLLTAYFSYVNPGNIYQVRNKKVFLEKNIQFLKSIIQKNPNASSKYYFLVAKAYQELRREDSNSQNQKKYLLQWKLFLEKALTINNSNSIYLESWFEWYRKLASFIARQPQLSAELLDQIYSSNTSDKFKIEREYAKSWRLSFSGDSKHKIKNLSLMAIEINQKQMFLFDYFDSILPKILRSEYIIKDRDINLKLDNLKQAKNYENRRKIKRIFNINLIKY